MAVRPSGQLCLCVLSSHEPPTWELNSGESLLPSSNMRRIGCRGGCRRWQSSGVVITTLATDLQRPVYEKQGVAYLSLLLS